MAEQTGASASPDQSSPNQSSPVCSACGTPLVGEDCPLYGSGPEHALLIEHPETGDCYYTGDLTAGRLLAENDGRIVKMGRHPSGVYWVHLNDSPDPDSTAEWGHGASLEEAFRYALGAMFGPIDSEYSEDHLRWVLDHTIR